MSLQGLEEEPAGVDATQLGEVKREFHNQGVTFLAKKFKKSGLLLCHLGSDGGQLLKTIDNVLVLDPLNPF